MEKEIKRGEQVEYLTWAVVAGWDEEEFKIGTLMLEETDCRGLYLVRSENGEYLFTTKIREVKKTFRYERWVIVTTDNNLYHFSTEKDSKRYTRDDVVACKKIIIEGREGEME